MTAIQELRDEVVGALGMSAESVPPMVRADRVYHLQMTAYRRGFMAGLVASLILLSALMLIASRVSPVPSVPQARANQ